MTVRLSSKWATARATASRTPVSGSAMRSAGAPGRRRRLGATASATGSRCWTRRRPAATAALVLCQTRLRIDRPRHLPARLRIDRPRRFERRLVAGEAQGPGAGAPLRHQLVEARLHLAPARVERRLLRRLPRRAAGRASPGTPGSPGGARRRRPGTPCRSPPARNPAPVPPSSASLPCPAPPAAKPARCGSAPRSASHSGAAPSARCSSRRRRPSASCSPARSGYEAGDRDPGW